MDLPLLMFIEAANAYASEVWRYHAREIEVTEQEEESTEASPIRQPPPLVELQPPCEGTEFSALLP